MFKPWMAVDKKESEWLQRYLGDDRIYVINNKIKRVYEVYRDAVPFQPAIYILEIPPCCSPSGYAAKRLKEIDTTAYKGGPKQYWIDFCKKEEAQEITNQKIQDDLLYEKALEMSEAVRMDNSSTGKLFYNLGGINN